MRVGVLTVSDSVSQGKADDRSGDSIVEVLQSAEPSVEIERRVVPDEKAEILAVLIEWADKDGLDAVITTGGTGLGPRDVTPEATMEGVTIRVPGIEEAPQSPKCGEGAHRHAVAWSLRRAGQNSSRKPSREP